MEVKTKLKSIRCGVSVHLSTVEWQDGAGVSVALDEPSVFVRACVLGQLQHSHLHTPTFPLTLNQTLSFDRILTNCRDPSLFKEVIHGEHVKFELIQVSSDFKGGKILARFDTPAHKFLFPDCPSEEDLHQLVMDRSRKYQHPPRLSYTCSTSLSEVTVHSPFDPPEIAEHRRTADSDSGNVPLSAVGMLHTNTETTSQEKDPNKLKLHSLLDSYLESPAAKPKERKTPYQVKFKPPIPQFLMPPKLAQSAPPVVDCPLLSSQLYQSTTKRFGPHQWEACPRRSPKRQHSLSAPSSPARRVKRFDLENIRPNIRPLSADADDSLALSDLEDPQVTKDTKPPFVVRHIDPHLMKRRDFCGCSLSKNSDKTDFSGPKQSIFGKDESLDDLELERSLPIYLNERFQMNGQDYVPTDRSRNFSEPLANVSSRSKDGPHSMHFTTPWTQGTSSRNVPPSYYSPTKKELMSKYLSSRTSTTQRGVCCPGNVRSGVDSPGRAIEERIERLMAECCNFKHGADSLGEDSLGEDLERLRASLQAERDDHLSRTGRLAPSDNVTVKIGLRDYWSRRMSEFTGKKHRLLFDETLEKIYNKLYTDACQSV